MQVALKVGEPYDSWAVPSLVPPHVVHQGSIPLDKSPFKGYVHVMTKGYAHVMTKGKRSGKKFRLNGDGAKLHIYAIDRDRSLQADDATSRGAEVAL